MTMTRHFHSLAQFAHFLEARAAEVVPVGKLAMGAAVDILERETKKEFGDQIGLAELAQSTQDERTAKGYTPNDPLLRDGKLLRDSVEREVTDEYIGVGTSEPIAAYHEFGYFNKRAQRVVPPRPVFKIGLINAAAPIAKIVENIVAATLGFDFDLTADVDGTPSIGTYKGDVT